jgi:hypothetical protein
MLANTASFPSRSGSKVSGGCGPNFGGMTNSQPASRNSFKADCPTSFKVRAVIKTFQDMAKA